MTYEEALEKVAKLLRLSKSDNPNEAALASQRAQEIMERFKIDALTMEDTTVPKPDEAIRDFGFDPLEKKGRLERWKGWLGMQLARMNQCICYSGQEGLSLIGRPSDVTTVRYIFGWLVREIEQLAAKNCAGCGRPYFNNYKIGATETVCMKLAETAEEIHRTMREEARVEVHHDCQALVRVDRALATIQKRAKDVLAWQKENVKLRSSGRGNSNTRYDGNARAAGRRDAQSINVNTRSAGAIGCGRAGYLGN